MTNRLHLLLSFFSCHWGGYTVFIFLYIFSLSHSNVCRFLNSFSSKTFPSLFRKSSNTRICDLKAVFVLLIIFALNLVLTISIVEKRIRPHQFHYPSVGQFYCIIRKVSYILLLILSMCSSHLEIILLKSTNLGRLHFHSLLIHLLIYSAGAIFSTHHPPFYYNILTSLISFYTCFHFNLLTASVTQFFPFQSHSFHFSPLLQHVKACLQLLL